jgi:hypothetical protein
MVELLLLLIGYLIAFVSHLTDTTPRLLHAQLLLLLPVLFLFQKEITPGILID